MPNNPFDQPPIHPRYHRRPSDLTSAQKFNINVGDLESCERGSGARANQGKPEYHQLPLFALEGVCHVLMYGAKKYKRANWAKGMVWSIPFDCAMRHLIAWQRGEDIDPESGQPHLDHALTNLIFLSAYRSLYPEGDDRITEFKQPSHDPTHNLL